MGQHQVNTVIQDQFLRHLCRTVRVGLTVLGYDLNLHRVAIICQPGKSVLQPGYDPILRFAKTGKRASQRCDKADFKTASCAKARLADKSAGAANTPPVIFIN